MIARELLLSGVKKDLVDVLRLAATLYTGDIVVIEGRRNKARQNVLFNAGKSQTLNSKHLTGHAIDIAPCKIDDGKVSLNWSDKTQFKILSDAMKKAAEQLHVPIKWGGDWATLKDMVHYELIVYDHNAKCKVT